MEKFLANKKEDFEFWYIKTADKKIFSHHKEPSSYPCLIISCNIDDTAYIDYFLVYPTDFEPLHCL